MPHLDGEIPKLVTNVLASYIRIFCVVANRWEAFVGERRNVTGPVTQYLYKVKTDMVEKDQRSVQKYRRYQLIGEITLRSMLR